MDSVTRELSSLCLSLETLRDDSARSICHESLQDNFGQLIGNIDQVTKEIEGLLTRTSSLKVKSRVQWSLTGRDEMNKLRSSFEAYKCAIGIALDMGMMCVAFSPFTAAIPIPDRGVRPTSNPLPAPSTMFSKTVLGRLEASTSDATIQPNQKNARFRGSGLHSVPFVDLSSIPRRQRQHRFSLV